MLGDGESAGSWLYRALHPEQAAIEDHITDAGGSYTPASTETVDAVDRFRAAAAQFWNVFTEFNATQSIANESGNGDEWNALNDRAATAQSYIAQIGDAVASAWSWSRSVFGLSGARMGILPMIPIAIGVILAAIAYLTTITYDMIRFNRRMTMISAGELQAGEETGAGTGALGDMTGMIKWGIVGVVAFTVLPQVLRAWEKK